MSYEIGQINTALPAIEEPNRSKVVMNALCQHECVSDHSPCSSNLLVLLNCPQTPFTSTSLSSSTPRRKRSRGPRYICPIWGWATVYPACTQCLVSVSVQTFVPDYTPSIPKLTPGPFFDPRNCGDFPLFWALQTPCSKI